MLHILISIIYVGLITACLFLISGLALLLWDDISAERNYKSRRDL
jgi:hypothetical protein